LNGLDKGGAGGEHGIGDDDDAAFEFGAGNVIESDLEAAVALVFAESGDEAVIGLVEEIEQALVEGQAGAEDGGDDRLAREYFGGCDAEGGLDFFFRSGEVLADLVGGDLSDAFEVASETHAVQLDLLVADLADPVAEEGILFREVDNHKGLI
jgi:hypothetical protein